MQEQDRHAHFLKFAEDWERKEREEKEEKRFLSFEKKYYATHKEPPGVGVFPEVRASGGVGESLEPESKPFFRTPTYPTLAESKTAGDIVGTAVTQLGEMGEGLKTIASYGESPIPLAETFLSQPTQAPIGSVESIRDKALGLLGTGAKTVGTIAKSQVESWKETLRDPIKQIKEKPVDFVFNLLDATVLLGGTIKGATGLARYAKYMKGKKFITGKALKGLVDEFPGEIISQEAKNYIRGRFDDGEIIKRADVKAKPTGYSGEVIADTGIVLKPELITKISPEGKVVKVGAKIPIEKSADDILADSAKLSGYPQGLGEVQTGGSDVTRIVRSAFETTRNAAKEFFDLMHSPAEVLTRDVAGSKIYDLTNVADIKTNKWIGEEFKLRMGATKGIKKNSVLDAAIFKVLDSNKPFDDIIKMDETAAISAGLMPDEFKALRGNIPASRKAHDFLKDRFNHYLRTYGKSKMDDAMEAKLWKAAKSESKSNAEWAKKLTPDQAEIYDLYRRRINDYVPHIFDKDVVLDFVEKELKLFNEQLAKGGLDEGDLAKLTGKIKNRENMIEGLTKSDAPFQWTENIPQGLRNRFLDFKRKGMPGYSTSALRAYDTYLYGIARKLFDEPAIKASAELLKEMPSGMRPYAEWYLRRFAGTTDKSEALKKFTGNVRSLMWVKTLGFNPRSAVVNLTQRLNTFAVEPALASRAFKMAWTKKGKALFEESGLSSTIPQVLMEGAKKSHDALEKFREFAGTLFAKAEKGNLQHGFLTGYLKGKKLGLSDAESKTMGIKLAQQTQFRYGRAGTPKAFTELGGIPGTAMQFWSYPIKQLEFLSNLWKKDKASLFRWIGLAEGTRTVADLLGLDFSSSMGTGFTYGDLFEALDAFSKGKVEKGKMSLETGLGAGGLLPYGFGPAIEYTGQVAEFLSRLPSLDIRDEDIGLVAPIAGERLWQMTKALNRQPDEEGEYEVKGVYDDQVQYRESMPEVLARTFITRPSSERKESDWAYKTMKMQELQNKILARIADLYAEGNDKEASAMEEKYGLEVNKAAVNRRIDERGLTKKERAERRIPKKGDVFREEYMEWKR